MEKPIILPLTLQTVLQLALVTLLIVGSLLLAMIPLEELFKAVF